ncbi:MAG: arginine--tRNA ligase [Candidatus Thiodiazotropha sp.]|jgi:arginyl-tRNA synthetase
MDTLEQLLNNRLSLAYKTVAGEPVHPMLSRSQYADYQSNAALGLAKKLKSSPREIATKVISLAKLDDLCAKVEISGPGFINLTLDNGLLGQMVGQASNDDRLGVPLMEPETVVVDYSSPNAAKEMHVGHLRSTIIGDAIVRILEWMGHRVIRQNHIGDWGTPFGMLIEHLLDIGEAGAAQELSVGDLSSFYTAARKKFDTSEEYQERSRRRVVLLQSGDVESLRLWQLLVTESKRYFTTVYECLDTRLTEDDFYGESAYNDALGSVVEDLKILGLISLSDGAECAFPTGFLGRENLPLPLIVRKSDGGYGYAATDLAALRYRINHYKATRLLYVVGMPQNQHLSMIFKTALEANWLVPPARAEHIGFGSVLGKDGKVLRSRIGGTIKLVDLLDEAVERAATLVTEKSPDLDEITTKHIAQAIGIGAVKYADLSSDRIKDYIFDFDRMLSFEGNTAPYLQYAHARIQSILRRSNTVPPRDGAPLLVSAAHERILAIELLSFPDVVTRVSENMELHRLANYLYDLATTFTSFYEHCPVLKAEDTVRASRLGICVMTANVLSVGLNLLGIKTPERM